VEDVEYQGLIEEVHNMIDAERLHVPAAIVSDPVELPFDLTEVSDKQLQSLYSAFASYSYREGYLLMLEESKEQKCREAADEIVTAYLAEKATEDGSVTSHKAQAEQIDVVKEWRNRQRMHGILAASQRKQRDGHDKMCERLSRLEAMRMGEYERAGQKLSSRPGARPRR